jgi:tight adherence protein C
MDPIVIIHAAMSSLSLGAIAVLLLLAGGTAVAWPLLAEIGARSELKRRLKVDAPTAAAAGPEAGEAPRSDFRKKAAKVTQDFYARTDAESVARIRMKLIQAGYMEPGAIGYFFLARVVSLVVSALAAFILVEWMRSDSTGSWLFIVGAGGMGYFLPSLALMSMVRKRQREYRNGFPDFMDLMVVCSDAGMSMEAAIERVAREIGVSYPALSDNLRLVSIELRAGRSLDDALKSLADRLSLDEVRSFATLLQQSRELGTSLSGALRVFSDEMRHKRMSVAEEKAHALPAKMSVPVTMCILPVILMIAVIPVIVKFSSGGQTVNTQQTTN